MTQLVAHFSDKDDAIAYDHPAVIAG